MDDNPLRKVTKPKEPRGRVRHLSDDERARLLAACKESDSAGLYPAVVLALCTGARRMEILGLRWGQVDFARRAITVLETKNGEIRSLPLVGHAFDLMEECAKVKRSAKVHGIPPLTAAFIHEGCEHDHYSTWQARSYLQADFGILSRLH